VKRDPENLSLYMKIHICEKRPIHVNMREYSHQHLLHLRRRPIYVKRNPEKRSFYWGIDPEIPTYVKRDPEKRLVYVKRDPEKRLLYVKKDAEKTLIYARRNPEKIPLYVKISYVSRVTHFKSDVAHSSLTADPDRPV
jgi:hypothetical protein